MTHPILQLLVLFFLLFAAHVYYLINLLLLKQKKQKIKNRSNIVLVLIGLGIIIITFGVFYNEFLIDKSLSELNSQGSITNWGYFGSYFGGIVAPILTFITLIILIRQINEMQKANKIQIEHMERTRRVEILTERINYTSNKANEKINQLHPLDDDIVKLYMESDPLLKEQKSSLTSITNDYNNKITYVTLSDKTIFPLEWRSIITYLNQYINKYEKETEDKLDTYFKVELHNIFVLINKTIALCCELSNLDKNSNQFIRFALTDFSYTVEELYKLKKIDQTIIDKSFYELFHKLISIHTNNENSLKDDTLKKLFAKELSTQLNQDIQEEDLSNIQFEVVEIMGYKQGVFSLTIKNKSYGRFSNIWKETVSQ